ncbi:uncharacterized protein LOC131683138 isoform X2 [Topomyia yanbarensis]|uniref:uncharacterized protein LOC131683138 isoform X2 n=1 Tax=Topomyia yanbarensis TaxID=2498891 RepID=UPI00273C4E99|nr:uncharacterized protein LOC131683138 isoform X2 [Topomyia yanbarensis]
MCECENHALCAILFYLLRRRSLWLYFVSFGVIFVFDSRTCPGFISLECNVYCPLAAVQENYAVEEGIDDMQTFVELDNYDFMRLKLRTKVIKLIQRMQKEILDDTVIEETLENESDEPNNNGEDDILNVDGEVVHEEELENNDRNNVYHGVVLETRTPNGKAVMEILKEGQKPNDICLTAIKRILCEYLKSMYGLRPSAFYKNLLAQSLVNTYPQLTSSTPDVPQALWFHPNGRGQHRHSGRLHYHMEYLAQVSGVRIVNRQKMQITQGKVISSEGSSTENTEQPVDMNAVIKELKFLCPGPNTKLRAEELWSMTIDERNEMRRLLPARLPRINRVQWVYDFNGVSSDVS